MIFNPLIVVASQLGIRQAGDGPPAVAAKGQPRIIEAHNRVAASNIGSVIVDCVNDEELSAASAQGVHSVRTDLAEFNRTHNYRSYSGAERIAATVNRFDRYYTHDIVVAVPDDAPDLEPHYMQALMYALAVTEVGIATLVSPLAANERDDAEVTKAGIRWIEGRIVYPLEGGKVGTVTDIRRDADQLAGGGEVCRLVPIHAWRRSALDRLVAMPPLEREFDEGTDLVRALDAGIRIDASLVWQDQKVLITPYELRGDELEG